MISTTSSKNNTSSVQEFLSVYCWSLRRNRGIFLLYFSLFVLVFPIFLLLNVQNALNSDLSDAFQYAQSRFFHSLSICYGAAITLSLIFGIILAAILYRYLHQKRSTDLFHSLPIRRIPLLLAHYSSGITILCIPVLFAMLTSKLMQMVYGFSYVEGIVPMEYPFLWIVFMTIVAFTFTTFMAICSGTTFDTIISCFVICGSSCILILCGNEVISHILPGYRSTYGLSSLIITAFSPYAAAYVPLFFSYQEPSYSLEFFLWWIFVLIVLFVFSLALYYRRKSECAENNFAFPIPKILIRFFATFSSALLGGLILTYLNSNWFNFFLGALLASLCAHFIAEAVYSRGFKRVKQNLRYYGVFVVAFLASYSIVATGAFGYDSRIPNPTDIESVAVNAESYDPIFSYTWNDEFFVYDEKSSKLLGSIGTELKELETIEKVTQWHRECIEACRLLGYPYSYSHFEGSNISITYHLKNGDIMSRYYSYSQLLSSSFSNQVYSGFCDLFNQAEYRETRVPIRYLEPNAIQSVELCQDSPQGWNSQTIELTAEKKEELIQAIRTDISEMTLSPDDYIDSYEVPRISIYLTAFHPQNPELLEMIGDTSDRVCFSNSYLDFPLTEQFKNTKDFLETCPTIPIEQNTSQTSTFVQ